MKARQQRPWKPRKRKRAHKPNREYLENYEQAIIARDLVDMGGRASAREMRLRYPMRYSEVYLPRVLKRMAQRNILKRLGNGRRGHSAWAYEPTDQTRALVAMSRPYSDPIERTA